MVPIAEIRKILGSNLSDTELLEVWAKVEFLTKSWMESYERTLFNGKTLKDVIDTLDKN